MTFSDIFKSSFLQNVTSVSILDMLIALALSFVLGLLIFLVYKSTFKGVMYSSSFGVSLVALSLITTLVILAVTSNVVLSLGMVGALSIVRFRTAIKEPLDIAFLFWAIAIGIVLGAGFIPLAVIGSSFIAVIMVVFANKKPGDMPYILVINCLDEAGEALVLEQLESSVKKHVIKSKTVSKDGIEFSTEIRLPEQGTNFINRILELPGVNNAVLVSYNGEYMA